MDETVNMGLAKHNTNTPAKAILLADVGGTNTRVALARDGAATNIQRFENADFASVYDLLRAYLDTTKAGDIAGCSLAMAGPVRGDHGRLTNRDWAISADGLKAATGCQRAVLQNDLTALGRALGTLPSEGLCMIQAPHKSSNNGQSLVIGMGTGFNLCPVFLGQDKTAHFLEVEMGHAALPFPIRDMLNVSLGKKAGEFITLEHLFSGSGLTRFHLARSGQQITAQEVVAAHESGNAAARATLDLYTKLLGVLCRELSFQYMPMNGIYFAGSVARGVLRPEFHPNIRGGAGNRDKVGDLLSGIPKWTILDDAAALRGCLAGYATA